jgi:hypothetical protein
LTMTVARERSGGRRVVLEGLEGATRVVEVLLLAGVQTGAESLVLYESRLVRGEATLAEAGLAAAGGGAVEMFERKLGGMPGADSDSIFAMADSIFATAQPDGAAGSGEQEELAGAVGGLLGQLSREETRLEGAVRRFVSVRYKAVEGPAANLQVDAQLMDSCPVDLRDERLCMGSPR